MTGASPTPKRLKVIDSSTASKSPSVDVAVIVNDAFDTVEGADYDLVSLRGHELLSSLASMAGCAELIDSGDLTHEGRRLYSEILLRESRRLTALINNTLALQNLETGRRALDLTAVDVRSLVRRAVLAVGEDDRRPITAHIPEQIPLVCAEPEAILEVLANFLANARAFSPDGGSIIISVRSVGDMVEIDIEDHGIGIEAEALPKLFRKFYRADRGVGRMAPGAGLGLTMNHRIIGAHGGRVQARSHGLGQGARFTFTLPIAKPDTTQKDVLIVEADAGFASLMRAELALKGLSTVRASDAETAEQMLSEMTLRAIILDLLLPGRQGEDFLATMWSGGGVRLPVVVLTGKNLGPAEISSLETAGALAVLPKEAGAPQAAVALIAEALALDPVAG